MSARGRRRPAREIGRMRPAAAALAVILLLCVAAASLWSVREALRQRIVTERDRAADWWTNLETTLEGDECARRIAALPQAPNADGSAADWEAWIAEAARLCGLPLCRVVDAYDRVVASRHWPASVGLPLPHLPARDLAVVSEPLAARRRPAAVVAWPLFGSDDLRLILGYFLDDPLFCPWPIAAQPSAPQISLLALPAAEGGSWHLIAPAAPIWPRPDTRLWVVPLLCALLAVTLAFAFLRRARAPYAAIERRLLTDRDRGGTPSSDGPGDLDAMVAELLRSRARLARRLRSARRLAGWRNAGRALAHEVRNALTPVRLAMETVYRRSAGAPESEALRAALRSLAAAEALLTEFTDFARLPRGAPRRIDLVRWLPEVVRRWSPARPIDLSLPDQRLWIEADPERLERAVGNLLRNALEVPGDQAVRVSLTQADDGARGPRLCLGVWNAGPAIPDEVGGRIFIEGMTTKPTGSGLGLAIARSVAQQMGGHLAYRNIGGGVTFEMLLPLASPPTEES